MNSSVNNNNYYLVFDTKKNGPMPVDIKLFDSNFDGNLSIENIDKFTVNYSNEELLEIVREANILSDEYLFGEIYIIDNNRRKFPVILKDTFLNFDLITFLFQNLDNKIVMNQLFNKYSAIVKNETEYVQTFKNSIESGIISEIGCHILSLNYLEQRKLMFYIVTKMFIRERKKEKEC